MSRITLTFDNGPDPAVTGFVLDVLKQEEIGATFFPIGHRLRLNEPGKDVLRRARDEGHRIGNHTFYHAYSFGDIDREDAVAFEFEPTFEELGDIADPRHLVRPYCYGGILDERTFKPIDVEEIRRRNYTCVLYNSVPRDWTGGDWVGRALDDAGRRDWTTVVLHDAAFAPGGVDAQPIARLPDLIHRARKAGFAFVQDPSPDVVVIADGRVLRPIDHLVHDGSRPGGCSPDPSRNLATG